MSEERARLFFIHVMKTAGTTFFFHLRAHLGPNWVFPEGLQVARPLQRGGQLVYFELEPLLTMSRAQVMGFKAFAGHYPYVASEMLGIDPVRVTILRDPVERSVSFLKHAKQYMPQFAEATAEEIYDDRETNLRFLQDHQTKVFSMRRDDELRSVLDIVDLDGGRLELAKANLAKVDLLGLQEHFDEFLQAASTRFGIELRDDVEDQRVGSVELDVPERLRQRIAEDNALDAELYRFAVAEHARRREADAVAPPAPIRIGRSEAEKRTTPRTDTTGPRFFLMHVMRTAGGTLLRDARATFPGDRIYPPPDKAKTARRFVPSTDIQHLLGLPADLLDEIDVVAGHFPLIVADLLGSDPTTILLLRDPVERAVDHLRNRAVRLFHNEGRSLEEIYDEERFFESSLHDHQAKQLAMTVDDPLETFLDVVQVDDRRLALAKANLERIDLLGLSEDVEPLRDELVRRFGWTRGKPKPPAPEPNVPQVSAALRARIEADNAADIELYEHARRLVAERARR